MDFFRVYGFYEDIRNFNMIGKVLVGFIITCCFEIEGMMYLVFW